MHRELDCILGIDTSNYKTSVAVTDRQGMILCDLRRLLNVKQGARGLRQSDALFQHMENLPDLLQQALGQNRATRIAAVAFSQKPRPVEGSYMPVFKAGAGFGQTVAAALQVPALGFSHQEGHLEAIRHFSSMKHKNELLCYHLSGGTSELLHVKDGRIHIIGGTKDLAFGQVVDRAGVKLGIQFPAGETMDQIALRSEEASSFLKKIPSDGLFFNLSGIETQCSRKAEELMHKEIETDCLVRELFDRITGILIEITEKAVAKTSVTDIMFTGGVSSSIYISGKLKDYFQNKPISIDFGQQNLSQDNAVGIALLGGKALWP